MIHRSSVRRWVARAGYGLGLTQALTRGGDRWRVLRDGHGFSIGRRRRGAFLVLIYHRVNRGSEPFSIERTRTDSFRAQMEHLARYFRVIPLGEIVKRLRTGEPLPPRAIAITFDDGYEDNFSDAFPVLRQLDLPATVFLTTGCIGTGQALWFERVLQAFRWCQVDAVTLPGGERVEDLGDDRLREQAAFRALYALMRLTNAERVEAIEVLIGELHPSPTRTVPSMLTWDQVRQMAVHGITFGAHTMTHPILSRLPLDEAEAEIASSKRAIEAETGQDVTLFAYPVGRRSDYTPEVIELVARSGFEAALTTTPGVNIQGDDLFLLHRVKPWDDDIPSFALGVGTQYVTEWKRNDS